MCGIAGWNLTEKQPDRFYLALASIMEQRGDDSWGYVNLDVEPQLARGIGPITQGAHIGDCLRGFLHTRAATTGKVTEENCHPFEIGSLIGAHNGVIYNHVELEFDYRDRTAPVDSMHIFFHMSEGKPLTELEGYGAIEYFDRETGKLYVGVCNDGSLEVALTSAGVVYASTKDAVRSAIFQAGLTLVHFYDVKQGEVYEIRSDAMYMTDQTFQMTKSFRKSSWEDLSKGGSIYSHSSISSGKGEWIKDKSTGHIRWESDPVITEQTSMFAGMSEDELADVRESFAEDVEVVEDACELCGEIDWLTELDGSFVCEQCKDALQGIQ